MKDLIEINYENREETLRLLKKYKEEYKQELEVARDYVNKLVKHINEVDIMITEIENGTDK